VLLHRNVSPFFLIIEEGALLGISGSLASWNASFAIRVSTQTPNAQTAAARIK
jgi:hypothetical protein